jgi:hypothetical protein
MYFVDKSLRDSFALYGGHPSRLSYARSSGKGSTLLCMKELIGDLHASNPAHYLRVARYLYFSLFRVVFCVTFYPLALRQGLARD